MKYEVNEWGSHPDENNDDCWTGQDFDTLEEARDCFKEQCKTAAEGCVELKGPDVHEVHDTGKRAAPAEDSGSWKREMAMEAGMLHGIQGYNDVMGYD